MAEELSHINAVMPKCFWHTFFCRLAVKKGCLDQESTLYQVVKFKFYACKQNCPISILNKMIPFAALEECVSPTVCCLLQHTEPPRFGFPNLCKSVRI